MNWSPEYTAYAMIVAAFGFVIKVLTMVFAATSRFTDAMVQNAVAQTTLAGSIKGMSDALGERIEQLEREFEDTPCHGNPSRCPLMADARGLKSDPKGV